MKVILLKKIIYHGLTVFLKDESEVTDNNVAFGFFVFERYNGNFFSCV